MSAAEYFTEFEAAAITFDEDDAASVTRAEAIRDPVERARTYFAGRLAVLETLLSEMELLGPPADVREAHDRALANGRAVAGALRDVLDELQPVDTPTELAVVQNSVAFTAALTVLDPAIESLTQSCVELTQAAAENGLTVDLRC